MHCGDIVIDKMLIIRATDDNFYQLVGDKNYGALSVSAHPDDLPLIYDAIDKLEFGKPIKFVYRIKTADGTYHFVLVQLSYENERCVADDRIHVVLDDLDELENAVKNYENSLAETERFLALTEAVLFEYNRIERHLKIFTSNWDDQYVLYEGEGSSWEKVSESLPIVEEDKDKLKNITGEVINGSGDIVETICFLEKSEETIESRIPPYFLGQSVTVRAKRVSTVTTDRVVGIISVGNAETHVNAGGLMDSCMDTTFNIYNKKTVTNYAENSIAQEKSGYLCVMDIDNFKTINDTYGHIFGDEVIKNIIEIARTNVKGAGMLGRIGGDEFMMVLDRSVSYADLRSILRSIRSKVEFEFKSRGHNITVSIGCAAYGENSLSYEQVFKVADKMLYRAKEKGRNRYVIYEPEIHGSPEDLLKENTVLKDKMRGKALISKESFMVSFIELFLHKKTMSYSVALESIAEVFGLDEVLLYFGNLEEPIYSFFAERNIEHRKVSFLKSFGFKYRLNTENVVAIAHPNTFGDQELEMKDFMLAYNYEAMVVYKGSKAKNCIVFAKRGSDIRKWENSDIAYLSFIGKILELEFENR